MANLNISELKTKDCPFADQGVKNTDFVELDSILDRPIEIIDYHLFENDKGPGVSVLIKLNGKDQYITTHAVNIVKTFQNPRVQAMLETETLDAVIVLRQSKKSSRMVYDFA